MGNFQLWEGNPKMGAKRKRRGTGGKSSPFKAGTKRLKKGYRYAKGGRIVRAKG